MNKKEFITISEQISTLRKKGLEISDDEKTQDILLKENYFFINGYRHPFLESNKSKMFIEGATFEELYSLFTFDRNLKYRINKASQ